MFGQSRWWLDWTPLPQLVASPHSCPPCLGLGRLCPSIPTVDAREWTKWTWPTCTLRRRPWVDGVFDEINWGCPVWDGLSRNPDHQVKDLGWPGWLGSNMRYTGQNCTFRMIMNQWMKWAGPIDSHPISWGASWDEVSTRYCGMLHHVAELVASKQCPWMAVAGNLHQRFWKKTPHRIQGAPWTKKVVWSTKSKGGLIFLIMGWFTKVTMIVVDSTR